MRILMFALLLTAGCGGSGGDDDSDVIPVQPLPTSVSNSEETTCPVNIAAESADEAVEIAELESAGDAAAVEDLGSLDQGSALRLFRVWLKDVTITIYGCDNGVVINDNDTSSSIVNPAPLPQ